MLHSSNRLAPNQHRRTSIGQCPWRSGWQCQDERLDCDSAHPEPFRDATRRSGLEDMVLSAAPAAQDRVADGEAALGTAAPAARGVVVAALSGQRSALPMWIQFVEQPC